MIEIVSFEPTPSPNVMKLNMKTPLADDQRFEFTLDTAEEAPDGLRQLLQISGVTSVYAAADFIALERKNGVDWRHILIHVPGITATDLDMHRQSDHQRVELEYAVYVQKIAGIPMQVKLSGVDGEYRFAMPDPFMQAAVQESKQTKNVISERKWHEAGSRYGLAEELGPIVVAEQIAIHPQYQERSERNANSDANINDATSVISDWQTRYAALSAVGVCEENLNVFAQALRDEHPSVRRLAVVQLGELKQSLAFSFLIKALRDPAISVRRTAGDTLSDLGDPIAVPYMIEALADKHKLMRWRAARYLYECGDASAITALTHALDDAEFEISLQAKMALERIVNGIEASGTMWQQIENRSKNVQ
jgi:hypothetical protein